MPIKSVFRILDSQGSKSDDSIASSIEEGDTSKEEEPLANIVAQTNISSPRDC